MKLRRVSSGVLGIAALLSTAAGAAEDTSSPFNIDLTPDTSAIVPAGKPAANPNAPSQSPISSVIQNLNPDISAIGDLVAGNPAALTIPGEPSRPPAYLREVEIDLAGYVSPFARAFFVTSVAPEDPSPVDIEEAYMTFFDLPLTANIKLGKARADIDTLNPLHPHAYPFVDFPLILQHLFGPEGLKVTGANVNFLLPNPWDQYIIVSGTVGPNPDYQAQDTALYGGTQQSLLYDVKVGTSFDLASATYLNLNAGMLYAPLANGTHSRTYIADALLRVAPNPVSDAYTLLTGFYWNQQDPLQTGTPFIAEGMYAYTGYQFHPRWKVGYRYDNVNDPFPAFGGVEQQHNVIVSFYPTETNYLRAQWGYHQLPGTSTWENRIWFQLNWALGPHALHMNL